MRREMKVGFLLSGIVGLATGHLLRKSQPAIGQDDLPPVDSVVEDHRGESLRNASGSLSIGPLEWGVRGDLSYQEIIDLPRGALRDAEAILWAQSASSDELGELWTELSRASYENRRFLPLLLSVLVEKDPERAFDHVKGTRFEGGFFAAWARIDPEQALAKARGRGSHAFGRALAAAVDIDPQRAMALAEEEGGYYHDLFLRGITKDLMKQNPRGALDFLADQGGRGLEGEFLQRWALFEPGEAFEWAIHRRSNNAIKIVEMVFSRDPKLVADLLEGMPAGSLKGSLQIARAKLTAKEDPEAGIQIAKEQPVGIRISALYQIGEGLPPEASELRMEILQDLLVDEGYQTPIGHHTQNWIMKELLRDPPSVISLYEEHDAERLPPLINGWVKKDPDRGVAWLSTRTDHESYDQMVEYIYFRSWMSDTAVTDRQMLGLLANLQDSGKASSSSRQVLRTWQRRDPEGLADFLESGSATLGHLKWWEEQSR